MANNPKLREFEKKHPRPDQIGVTRLFRFKAFNDEHPEHLEDLLVNLKLYHSLPKDLNDPFECRPNWNFPSTANEIVHVKKRLAKLARERGHDWKSADKLASSAIKDRHRLQEVILETTRRRFREVRVCSYSTSLDNILLWSHYADCHKGLCIEFDAAKPPLAFSMKVHYQQNYPEIEYPLPNDERGFETVLTKSEDWHYEKEFRTLLVPTKANKLENDGESYSIPKDAITNIYLGAEISTPHKDYILKLVAKSMINPKIWVAKLSENTYTINFNALT